MKVYDPNHLLSHLCSLPKETEWVKFKQNTFNPETVAKYVSALANAAILSSEEHGYLVFGIEDGTHNIVGTSVRISKEKVGTDTFLFWLSKQLTPKINVELCTFSHEGKPIEMLVVDPGYQQPVRFQGRGWIRVDTSLQPLANYTEREKAIWAIASRFAFEDGIVSPNLTPQKLRESFELVALLSALEQHRLTEAGEMDFLVKEGLVKDNLQGGFDATNLLALVSAHQLRDWALVSDKAPRVLHYKGKDKLDVLDDRTGTRGYGVTFPGLLKYIMGRIGGREQLLNGVRQIIYELPEVAVRELVANALIHQDLTISGNGPLVEIYSDKVRISNPGRPLIDTDRFINAPPRSRNIKLAHLMRRMGLCEQRGSGVDRALVAIEQASLPPPLFQVIEESTVVTIYGKRRFADMSKEERVRACYQHACLRFEASDYMSNASLRVRLGLTDKQYPQVSIVIADAKEAGMIRPLDEDQANRKARYVPYWV